MELEPKLVAQNRHVRAFAEANRLRFTRLPDGELVLPLGPRKRSAAKLGNLGTHAWWNGKYWIVFAQSPKPGMFARALKANHFLILERDGELEAHHDRDEEFLTIDLGASGAAFSPWRKRVVSDEQRRMTSERFAAMRRA